MADSPDAMTSARPYRRALPMSHAREEIKRCSGSQFDPKVVDVFMTIPERHWLDLRENLGSPFRLAHLKNLYTRLSPEILLFILKNPYSALLKHLRIAYASPRRRRL